jgi:hypothetical protein
MRTLKVMRALRSVAAAACLASSAAADTIVVSSDGAPGSDYTNIQSAINAAQPGDLILIHPGSYTPFTLFKPLTLLASAPGVEVSGTSFVLHIQAGKVAALAGLELVGLELAQCPGTIVLDSITGMRKLRASQCNDVRLLRAEVVGLSTSPAIEVNYSNLEVIQSELTGGTGFHSFTLWCSFCPNICEPGGPGSPGALVESSGVRAIFALGDSTGGIGGTSHTDELSGCTGGPGGAGIWGRAGAFLLLLGDGAATTSRGGDGGSGADFQGSGGTGLVLTDTGTQARHSGVSFQGGVPGGASVSVGTGATLTAAMPVDPSLGLSSPVPSPGGNVRYVVHGAPGDEVALLLGMAPRLIPLPGILVEQLTDERRLVQMGTIGATGNVTVMFPLPLPAGMAFYAQARIRRGGEELRTNSVAFVMRG